MDRPRSSRSSAALALQAAPPNRSCRRCCSRTVPSPAETLSAAALHSSLAPALPPAAVQPRAPRKAPDPYNPVPVATPAAPSTPTPPRSTPSAPSPHSANPPASARTPHKNGSVARRPMPAYSSRPRPPQNSGSCESPFLRSSKDIPSRRRGSTSRAIPAAVKMPAASPTYPALPVPNSCSTSPASPVVQSVAPAAPSKSRHTDSGSPGCLNKPSSANSLPPLL